MRHLRLVPCTETPAMTLKIAFASSDRRLVDQHFGVAEALAIYELAGGDTRLTEVVQFQETAMDRVPAVWRSWSIDVRAVPAYPSWQRRVGKVAFRNKTA
jgi:hypothetical protein